MNILQSLLGYNVSFAVIESLILSQATELISAFKFEETYILAFTFLGILKLRYPLVVRLLLNSIVGVGLGDGSGVGLGVGFGDGNNMYANTAKHNTPMVNKSLKCDFHHGEGGTTEASLLI